MGKILLRPHRGQTYHYNDVTMSSMASQITSLTIVYSTVYLDVDQRKYQSSASLAFVWSPVNFPHKGPVTRKMFPFDDVIMTIFYWTESSSLQVVACYLIVTLVPLSKPMLFPLWKKCIINILKIKTQKTVFENLLVKFKEGLSRGQWIKTCNLSELGRVDPKEGERWLWSEIQWMN